MLMFNILILVLSSALVDATQQCTVTEIKSLLEGCDRVSGLNITSVGGTIVNDHNCDVLLPKQVFMEEPLYQFQLADSVIIYDKSKNNCFSLFYGS